MPNPLGGRLKPQKIVKTFHEWTCHPGRAPPLGWHAPYGSDLHHQLRIALPDLTTPLVEVSDLCKTSMNV